MHDSQMESASLEGAPRASLLVVDDEPMILSALCAGLCAAGYRVTAASSGEDALDRAREAAFDLALLDIVMAGISGIELARRLRQAHDLAAFFISGHSDSEIVDAAVAGGAVGFAVKPVEMQRLVPALETALARARDQRALAALNDQLRQALDGGRSVSEAVGILMEREGLTRRAAFEALRGRARAHGEPLETVAAALVAAEETLNEMSEAGSPARARNRRT